MPTGSLVAEFKSPDALESPELTLVEFWAPWCGPCRVLAPVIEELAYAYEGRLRVGKVNVDENPWVSGLNILSIPTTIVFDEGREVARFVGAAPRPTFSALIEPHLAAA